MCYVLKSKTKVKLYGMLYICVSFKTFCIDIDAWRCYNPIFESKIEQNTAGRLVLHSFPSGAFSFYYIVFFS